jgi:hypothetical protein
MVRERDIEKHLVERVKALGGEVRKVQWVGRNGAPDRLVMLPIHMLTGSVMAKNRGYSLTIWVELKAPGKKPTVRQVREHERMREMGQRVVVVDSIDGVDELLGTTS